MRVKNELVKFGYAVFSEARVAGKVVRKGSVTSQGDPKWKSGGGIFEPGGSKEAKSENPVSSIQNLLPAKLVPVFCLACDDHNTYDMLIILYNRSVTVSLSLRHNYSVCVIMMTQIASMPC